MQEWIEKVYGNPDHGFKNFKEAMAWAKANIVGILNNEESGGKGVVRISGQSIEKYLSHKAVEKSTNIDVHFTALKVLPALIKTSTIVERHMDKYNDEHLKEIQRLYGCLRIGNIDYRVKTTLKRYSVKDEPGKVYTYEVTKIELLEGFSATDITPSVNSVPPSNNSIHISKLLQGVVFSK